MLNTKPKNIRLDEKMDARLHHAADQTGLPLADVMRMALALGLKDLELMKYDIDGAIYDRVMHEKSKTSPPLAGLPGAEREQLEKQA